MDLLTYLQNYEPGKYPKTIVIIKSHHIVRTMQLQEGSNSCISNRLNNWKNKKHRIQFCLNAVFYCIFPIYYGNSDSAGKTSRYPYIQVMS